MTAAQTAYLATCGLMVVAGVLILALGVALDKVTAEWVDWPGLVIGLGLMCMIVGPLMLIGFPS